MRTSTVDERLLVKIAHYYYRQDLTQEQIARKLGMSRQKVNRLIGRLKEEGIVTISIRPYADYCLELEDALEKRFNLSQAVVITRTEERDVFETLGVAGANYLDDVVQPDSILGVAWGRTLQSVARHLVSGTKSCLSIVQLAGGVNPENVTAETNEVYTQSSEITRILARKLGATPYFLHAPIFVESQAIKDALMSGLSIRSSFDMIARCSVAMTSIGGVGENATPFKHNLLPREDLVALLELGCVGNICFRYYDIDGNIIPTPFDSRIMGPTIQELKRIPLLVGIAGGEEKVQAILGALRGGFFDVLITDSQTATAVITES